MTIGPGQDNKSEGSVSPQSSPKPRSYKVRDPRWLQVNVCHEFTAGRCLRNENECHFAHPPSNCLVEHGKVTACFDAMKGRCQRETCKYFHPPKHIKDHLEALGRSYQQQRIALQRQHSEPCGTMANVEGPVLLPSMNQGQWVTRWCSAENLPAEPVVSRSPTLPRRLDKSDKLEICSEFMNNSCQYDEKSCPFAHPPSSIPPDSDGYVTVCMDFMKGECQRVTCRYFHPPPHLQARVRAAQRRPSQMSGHVVMGGNSPMPPQQVILISQMPFPGQQIPIPPGALPPLIPASQELFIPVNGYQDASCMMPVPMPPMQPCFLPSGETVFMPFPRENFQPVPVPGQIMGHCFEMMTPPATP